MVRKQRRVEVNIKALNSPYSEASFTYDSSSDFGTGKSGVHTDLAGSSGTGTRFDNFLVYPAPTRDAMTPRISGLADGSISSSELLVRSNLSTYRGGEVAIENFADTYYMVQADVKMNSGTFADVWVRYVDPNNGYRVRLDSFGNITLHKYRYGQATSLATSTDLPPWMIPLPMLVVPEKVLFSLAIMRRWRWGGVS